MLRVSATDFARLIYSRIVTPELYTLGKKYLRKSITVEKLLRKFPRSFRKPGDFSALFKQSLRQRFFLSDSNRKDFYLNLLTSLGGFDNILDDADLVHENKYQTLGSEVFSFGDKIDWHLDFRSGKRWPMAYYTNIDVLGKGERKQEERARRGIGESAETESRYGGEGQESGTGNIEPGTANLEPRTWNLEHADVKVPWEVNRFHQAIWLGKAYWVSHSESHTEKFMQLVNDWIEENPAGYGINWRASMEVAIRGMNLIVGLLFFMGSPKLDDEFLLKLLCSLYEHGVYIWYNLERSPRNHNHLISDLVGLLYLGILFHDTDSGKRWTVFAHRELEREMLGQVYEDGTDYEKSTSYQRLVIELFTAAYVLLKLNNFSVTNTFSRRLESMYTFLSSSTMQDGRIPPIGDSDDGRIFRMKTKIDFNDHRDLTSIGATLFGRSDLKAAAGGFSEIALLLLGSEGFEKFTSLESKPETSSRLFKEGGFAFLRTGKDFCSFDFGDLGQRGRGGHGHNDLLSLTVSGNDHFLVDRGTFCYSSDAAFRNKLRSTYSHNTIVVDEAEQAEFAGLWSVKKDMTSPELVEWTSTRDQDVIEALHHAYTRLADPVTHKRKITFNKSQRTFIIEDNLLGKGDHKIEMMFHFAPEVKVVDLGRNFIVLEGKEFALLKFERPFKIENWEHSPSYGVIQRAKTARVELETQLPFKIQTFIFIISSADEMNRLLNRIRDAET